MKEFTDQDNYEILETPRGASPEEIERAYRLAMATYADDSLAGYSIFGEGDAGALRERIESAYEVLSDSRKRAAYDALLPDETEPGSPYLATDATALHPDDVPSVVDALEELDQRSGEFDGARLRRMRMRRDLEIDQIAGITKINPLYLHCIEEERFENLPAEVYVRGFVCAYAQCVGLDPIPVAKSYMKRIREHRGSR